MTKKLHIISFNIPSPPNYGGVIDVYYKLESLHRAGIEIYLHCFEYNRPRDPELEKLCHKIFYYPRQTDFKAQLSVLPFIVKGRNHPELLQNLLSVTAPILFEGLHACYFLVHPLLGAYKKIVRTHNIEHQYYFNLYNSETTFYKRCYYAIESLRLKLFESKLKHAQHILAISETDTTYFQDQFETATFIPPFHPFRELSCEKGYGDYVLFHGDLSVTENQKAVKYLIRKIFSEITLSFIIAGKNPPEWLVKMVKDIPHISLVENPSRQKMDQLIHDAQICLIPAFQSSGMKLKLLASLFGGKHCVTNSIMVQGTDLKNLCHIADTPQEMIQTIQKLIELKFDKEDIHRRKLKLETFYSNDVNAQKIIEHL
ncbi:glycosyltransferase [Mangrovibacterium lignilyticum]|uniref:glycosyltransferase n=1 Tax=Mangrovibacterium lignilyticum TaxID=2668052 RepID=UPI0013D51289|nr:glycosyltransferase [Mangrovibacterium lignilyticum]